MANKLLTIEELQSEIESNQKIIKMRQERILEYQGKMNSNKSMKSTYKRNIDTLYREISKCDDQIKQFEYQISVGGRKLKTSIAVTKDLISAGFRKGEYTASSMIRGWGDWRGDFTVKNNPKSLFINWLPKVNEKFDRFYEYLVDKYGEDVSKDEFNNVTIMK